MELGSRHLDQLIGSKSALESSADLKELVADLPGHEADEVPALRAEITGEDAFHLYETYGMPLDFMVDAARDAGVGFDMRGFERAKEEEQQRARASWKGGSQKSAAPVYRELERTAFDGYTALRVDGARVLALVRDGVGVAELAPGDAGEIVLDATSFYADSGGQVGDVGWIRSGDGKHRPRRRQRRVQTRPGRVGPPRRCPRAHRRRRHG